MYAIFLLVLLADVARAEPLVSVRMDAAGGLNLSAPAQAGATERSVPILLRQGRRPIRLAPDGRNFGAEFFSSYRTILEKYCQTRPGAMQSLFDGSQFAAAVTLTPLDGVDPESALTPWVPLDPPLIPILEHTSSPAP